MYITNVDWATAHATGAVSVVANILITLNANIDTYSVNTDVICRTCSRFFEPATSAGSQDNPNPVSRKNNVSIP